MAVLPIPFNDFLFIPSPALNKIIISAIFLKSAETLIMSGLSICYNTLI